MNNITLAILIGLAAGLIDVTPMLLQKLDRRDSVAAFLHYFALGIIIPFVQWDIAPWGKGILIAFLTAIPTMVLVYPKDKKAIIPMIIFAILLGAGIGIAGAYFIV